MIWWLRLRAWWLERDADYVSRAWLAAHEAAAPPPDR